MPRFQPPPRRTQRADFPHYAPPFASCQGLWDLSCWGDFRLCLIHRSQPRPFCSWAYKRIIPETPEQFGLHLDIYSPPQVLQIGGRLCHLVLASLTSETLQMAGPLRSTDVTPLHRYCGPSRHPLVFGRLPGFAGYTAYLAPAISRRDEEGFSSCSACPGHRAVASTPPRWPAVSVNIRLAILPSPLRWRLGPREYAFSRPQCVHFYYGPVTRNLP